MVKTNDNMIPYADKTIFAWATAPGRAGVAVMRISGTHALAVLSYLGVTQMPSPRQAALVSIKHPKTGALIDCCLCLTFPTPASFTGEDVVELHTHGSRAIIQSLTDCLSEHPHLRLAEPGEFSRRAFINNKMDLIQAEGLADLIDAETQSQHAQAMRQMEGAIGKRYYNFRERILQALALMEAYIDFPDEEIPDHVTQEANETIQKLKEEIDESLTDKGIGEKIREGLVATIIGAPNAGKSSLLNTLSGRDVAIVSEEAGTTRDMIEVHLNLDGYPLTIIDTAGLRQTDQSVEAEGIRRAKDKAKYADLKIAVFDFVTSSQPDEETTNLIDKNTIVVCNKADLAQNFVPEKICGIPPITLSTSTNCGVDNLIRTLKTRVESLVTAADTPIITRARHRQELAYVSGRLSSFLDGAPLELMTEDLRSATQAIARITGKIDVDDVLDIIFGSFCIGK